MAERKKTCSILTWKASKKTVPLNRSIGFDSEYIYFARQWISKFNEASRTNVAEKMIYLWVTINAWASIVVPDKTRNHEDSYLIHAMAADKIFAERFDILTDNNTLFFRRIKELLDLAPVFQVLWLRNNVIEAWDPESSRKEYINYVISNQPYTIKKNKDGSESKLYHYRPECAQTHIGKNEPIPADWPHVLHIIYQIRCNLFHGGKNYSSDRDRRFVELAYKILWEMFEPEFEKLDLIDTTKEIGLSWGKLFIRSGFIFEKLNNAYDFSSENSQNISYLKEILSKLEVADQFSSKDNTFKPHLKRFSEDDWLKAIEALHTGAEWGASDMAQIELKIMDTYMAGLVRWLNYIGLSTTYSCDGHNRKAPVITFAQAEGLIMFESMLKILSAGSRFLIRQRDSHSISFSNRRTDNNRDYDRSSLLLLAEMLHRRKDDFSKLINVDDGTTNWQRGN
jgi:hypothetical protein